MNEIDRDALERALVAARAEDEGRAKQIDSMLASEPWEEVAQFASYCVQGRALNLQPGQSPPCHASLASLRLPYGDPRAARERAAQQNAGAWYQPVRTGSACCDCRGRGESPDCQVSQSPLAWEIEGHQATENQISHAEEN